MIEKLTEADFDQMFSLMERSFPEDERRDYNGQRELLANWLPCLCRMDYGTYDMVGAELIRTKTLAAGDDCCNFHVIRKKG